MKRTIICLTIVFLNIAPSFAQMKKIENVARFVQQMEQNASSVKSIESDFQQIKHLDTFDHDITSSGKFYYKASDKISLNYETPLPYLVVINDNKIKIESDGNKNIMNLKDNKQMREMHSMMMVCMTGNLANISNDYLSEFYEDGQSYLVTVKPVNENIKKYILQFDIYLNKKDLSVDKLRISEIENDYTEYYFNNKKFNTLNNDILFNL
jgi:outer membrane lipoprotein-sorting protein